MSSLLVIDKIPLVDIDIDLARELVSDCKVCLDYLDEIEQGLHTLDCFYIESEGKPMFNQMYHLRWGKPRWMNDQTAKEK